MDLNILDKNVLVTGGTRGIGLAAVRLFLAEGCRVSTCARSAIDKDSLNLPAEQASRLNVDAVDVSDHQALKDWVEKSATAMRGVDILLANVSGFSEGVAVEQWQKALDVDLLSTKIFIDAAAPYLTAAAAEKGEASVVAVSSASASLTMYADAYGAMKAALIHYIKGCSKDLAASGIRVNSISPGTIYFAGSDWEKTERNNPEVFKQALAMNPTGRMGSDKEVADAIVYLSSPRASFINGANIVIDGGLTSQLMI
ncbi:MAG: SDR family NAD(P)-dependent oxidoreductase [Pseudomonadales bacterium]